MKGLWLSPGVVILYFGLTVFAQINPRHGSWNDLVFAAMTAVFTITLATYVAPRLIASLFSKKQVDLFFRHCMADVGGPMEYMTPYLVALAIGLAYFGIVMFLVKKFNFKYSYGLILPAGLVIFFMIMTFIGGQTDTTGWQALGYLVMTILSGVVLIGYVLGWVVFVKFNKKH